MQTKGFLRINNSLFECDMTITRIERPIHSDEPSKSIVEMRNVQPTLAIVKDDDPIIELEGTGDVAEIENMATLRKLRDNVLKITIEDENLLPPIEEINDKYEGLEY